MKKIIPLAFLTVSLAAIMQPTSLRPEACTTKPQMIAMQNKKAEKPQGTMQTEGLEINEEGVLVRYSGKEETVQIPEGVVKIGEKAFQGNSTIQKVILPDTVTEIGNYAFDSCKNLSDVEGGNLLEIEQGAFYGSAVQRIDLSSVRKIGWGAFSESALKEVHLENVEELGGYVFEGCKNLETVTGLEHLSECGDSVFHRTPFEENYWKDDTKSSMWIVNGILLLGNHCTGKVTVPDSVRKIAGWAFHESKLEQVFIPDTVTEIGSYAFACCSELTSVRMEDSVTYIGQHCFSTCLKLTEIRLSNALTDIGDTGRGIIDDCSKLEHLTLPASLKKLGPYSFMNCRKLKTLTIPPDLEEYEGLLYYLSFNPFDLVYTFYVTDIAQVQKLPDLLKHGNRVVELELAAEKVCLGVGSKFPLRFNSNAKAEKWTSSNRKVVTVDRVGNLYAKGAGTATITALIYGKEYHCEVTVE